MSYGPGGWSAQDASQGPPPAVMPYPGQPHPGQPYPGQPHPGLPHPGMHWQAGPFPAAPVPPLHGSGLFPGQPQRPVYREQLAVRTGPLLAGFGATVLWFALFGGLATSLMTYGWWTLAAATIAWIVAVILGLIGDRGVATGVALAAGLGLSIATSVVAMHWITTYDWPLW